MKKVLYADESARAYLDYIKDAKYEISPPSGSPNIITLKRHIKNYILTIRFTDNEFDVDMDEEAEEKDEDKDNEDAEGRESDNNEEETRRESEGTGDQYRDHEFEIDIVHQGKQQSQGSLSVSAHDAASTVPKLAEGSVMRLHCVAENGRLAVHEFSFPPPESNQQSSLSFESVGSGNNTPFTDLSVPLQNSLALFLEELEINDTLAMFVQRHAYQVRSEKLSRNLGSLRQFISLSPNFSPSAIAAGNSPRITSEATASRENSSRSRAHDAPDAIIVEAHGTSSAVAESVQGKADKAPKKSPKLRTS